MRVRDLIVAASGIVGIGLSTINAGNVIFLHPDGAGIAHWQAARFFWRGPDADLEWDKLPHVAVYRGHNADNLTSTSNGGATIHAYGVKVPEKAFGSDGVSANPPVSAGGQARSLMQEAMDKEVRVGVINSGALFEPGTACFLSSVKDRRMYAEITKQVVESKADIILSGGEEWFLPAGVKGRHGSGSRPDGLNLIDLARELGYTVVFDRFELAAVPPETKKLLGIFARGHTFHDVPQAELDAAGLPFYVESAPTVAEMTYKALELLGDDQFFLVIEEEGSDNFGNNDNARGVLEALRRADEAIGISLDFINSHPDTLLITTADSEAGGMDVIGLSANSSDELAVAANGRDRNGAPYSLYDGGIPFESMPDQNGRRHKFVINWSTFFDTAGGIVVRAAGKNADMVTGSFDNTDVYRVMRETLFEQE